MANEEITIEIGGKTFRGSRVIEGKRTLRQTIYYGDRSERDSHPYKPDQASYMKSIAKLILSELVTKSGDAKKSD